jgi:hypothetical protein
MTQPWQPMAATAALLAALCAQAQGHCQEVVNFSHMHAIKICACLQARCVYNACDLSASSIVAQEDPAGHTTNL